MAADDEARAAAPAIPKTKDDLSAGWVAQALAAGGRPGCKINAVQMRRIGEGVGMLTELYRLDLTHARGGASGPASVIAKLHSSQPQARELCAAYGFYEREMRFYQDIAATIELRTPAHYFSAFDAVSGDCVILLEDLAPAKSPDQVAGIPLAMLTCAIDGAAALHARWWDDPRLDELRGSMPSFADPPYVNSIDIYRACLPAGLARLKALGQHDLARVAEKLGLAIERLIRDASSGPLTLNHGDFRADNLMFRQTSGGLELTVVDWQIVMQSRGPFDVGYLMGLAVPVELRRAEQGALLRRYHDKLIQSGVKSYSFEDCLLDYRRAVLIGLSYWAQSFPTIDLQNARAVALSDGWAERLSAAISDLGLEALLD